MIQDRMIEEIQEPELSGYTPRETHDELRRRHRKVPSLKTVRKYYNMDGAPEDSHAAVRKQMAFDVEPLRSAVIEAVSPDPGCSMSSVYDVPRERFVETGEMGALPGNEQTLRHLVHRPGDDGAIPEPEEARRTYDVLDTPPAGDKAQVDFGQQRCAAGPAVHLVCVLLWHSRLLWVYAQDHKFDSEEACRAPCRFFCRVGGRVRTLVIGQDSVFVGKEACGEVFETETFRAFLAEQQVGLWVCRKADPESKGAVENTVKFVKTSYFSARKGKLATIEEVRRTLPAWLARKNRRIHQGTYRVPQAVFEDEERGALLPLLPSFWEAAPVDLVEAPASGQPYVPCRSARYSVPWEMCYSTAYYRVIGTKPRACDSDRRYVCTHETGPARGSFQRLDEHRRQPASDWLDVAERMRKKWNCTDFQHFINGFKRENPERHLSRQLAAVERYLDQKAPTRAFAAEVMAACCRDHGCRLARLGAVYEGLEEEGRAGAAKVPACAPAGDVAARGLERYQEAFEERCGSRAGWGRRSASWPRRRGRSAPSTRRGRCRTRSSWPIATA